MPRGPSDSSSQIKTKVKKTGAPKVVRKGKATESPKKAAVKRLVVKSPVKKLVKALSTRKNLNSSAKSEKNYLLKLKKENASKKVKKRDTAKEKPKVKNDASEVKNLTKSVKKQDKTVKQEKKTNSEKNNSKKLEANRVVKRGRKRKLDETKSVNSSEKSILNTAVKEKEMNKKIKVGIEQSENLHSEKEELNSSKSSGTSKLIIEQSQKPGKRVTRTLQKRDTSKYEDQRCSTELSKQKVQKDTGDKPVMRKTRLTREKDKASEEILAELAAIKAGTNTKSIENLNENKNIEEFSNKSSSEKNIVTRKTRQTLKQGEENITVVPQETKSTEKKSAIKVPVIREFEKTSAEKQGESNIRNNRSLRSTLKNLKESDNENSTDNISVSVENTIVQGETKLNEIKLEEQSVAKVSVIKEAEKASAEQKPTEPSIRKIRSLRLLKASENEDSSDSASASEFSENDSSSNLEIKRESRKRKQLLKPVESILLKSTNDEKVVKNKTVEVEMHTTILTPNSNYNESSKNISGCKTRSTAKQITDEAFNSENEKSIDKVSSSQDVSSNISVDLSERNESTAENVENNNINSASLVQAQLKDFPDSDRLSHKKISSDNCQGILHEISSGQADAHVLEISEPSDAIKVETDAEDTKELPNVLYIKLEIDALETIPAETVLNDTSVTDTTETSTETQCDISSCETESSSKLEKCNAEEDALVNDSLETPTEIPHANDVIPSETENSLKLENYNVSLDHISNTLDENSSKIQAMQRETIVTLSDGKIDLKPNHCAKVNLSPNNYAIISIERTNDTSEKDTSETCTAMQCETAVGNTESSLGLKHCNISSDESNNTSVNINPELLKSSENIACGQDKLSIEIKPLECDNGFSKNLAQNSSPGSKDTSSEHVIKDYANVTLTVDRGYSSDEEIHGVKTTDSLQENSESNSLLTDCSTSHVEKISLGESNHEAKSPVSKIEERHSEIISSQSKNSPDSRDDQIKCSETERDTDIQKEQESSCTLKKDLLSQQEKDPPSKTFQAEGTDISDNIVTQPFVKPTLCREETNFSSENLADNSETLKLVETNNEHNLKSSPDDDEKEDLSNTISGSEDSGELKSKNIQEIKRSEIEFSSATSKVSGDDVDNIGSPKFDSQNAKNVVKEECVDSQIFSKETDAESEACFSAASYAETSVQKTFTEETLPEFLSENSNLVTDSTYQDSLDDNLTPTSSSEIMNINLVEDVTLNQPCEKEIQNVSFTSLESSKNEDEIKRKFMKESETDPSNIVKDDTNLSLKNDTLPSFLDTTSDNLISDAAYETSADVSLDTKEQIKKQTDCEVQSLENTHISLETESSQLEYSKNNESDGDEVKNDSNAADENDPTSQHNDNESTIQLLDVSLDKTSGYESNNTKGETSPGGLNACEVGSKSSEESCISNKNDDESQDKNVSFQTNNVEKLNETADYSVKTTSVHDGEKDSFTKEINSPGIIQTVNISFVPLNQKEDSIDDFSDNDKEKILSGKKSQNCMGFDQNTIKYSSVEENNSLFENEERSEKDILKESHDSLETSRNLNVIPVTIETSTDANFQLSCDKDSTSAAVLIEKENVSIGTFAGSDDKNKKDSSEIEHLGSTGNLNLIPIPVETSTDANFRLSRDKDSTSAAVLIEKENVSIGGFAGSDDENKNDSSVIEHLGSKGSLNLIPIPVETSTDANFQLSHDNDSNSATVLIEKENVSIGAFAGRDDKNEKKSSVIEAIIDTGDKDRKILDEVSGEFVDIDSLSNTVCSSNERINKPVDLLCSRESISSEVSTNHKSVKRKHDDSDGDIVTLMTKSVKLGIESDKPQTGETDIDVVALNSEQSQLVLNSPRVEHTNEISNCIIADQSNRNIAGSSTFYKNTSPKNVLSEKEITLNPECEQKIETELSHNKDNLGTNESTSDSSVSQSEKNVPVETSVANLSDCSKPGSSKSPSKRKAAESEDSNELKRVKANTPPVREYLDQFVPFLLEGLLKIAYNRPEDPIQYLAEWMIFNKDEAYKRIKVAR